MHRVTTILATSKNVLFLNHYHLLTTGTDDPTLWLSPDHQREWQSSRNKSSANTILHRVHRTHKWSAHKSRQSRRTFYNTVIHLFQPDPLELRAHLVMFQSTTLQGQAGLSEHHPSICISLCELHVYKMHLSLYLYCTNVFRHVCMLVVGSNVILCVLQLWIECLGVCQDRTSCFSG